MSVEKVREKLAEVKKKKQKQLNMKSMSAKEIYQDRISATKKAISDKRTREEEVCTSSRASSSFSRPPS